MNRKTIITALLALVSLGAGAQLESVKELNMKSKYFNHERQVLIYTSVGYQEFDQIYYDVIYRALSFSLFRIWHVFCLRLKSYSFGCQCFVVGA